MTSYRVVWEIDIEAETPQAAAEQAHAIQRDPYSMATVFTANGVTVDLPIQWPEGVRSRDDLLESLTILFTESGSYMHPATEAKALFRDIRAAL